MRHFYFECLAFRELRRGALGQESIRNNNRQNFVINEHHGKLLNFLRKSGVLGEVTEKRWD